MSRVSIQIADAYVPRVDWRGLSLYDNVNQRGSLSFSTVSADYTEGLRFVNGQAFTGVGGQVLGAFPNRVAGEPGQEATLLIDGVVKFRGVIDAVDTEDITNATNHYVRYTYNVVDLGSWAQFKVVAETYESTTAGAIVQDVITNKLAAVGITAGTIETGATFDKIVFNYRTVQQVLDELAESSDKFWRVNDDKTLDFVSRSAATSALAVTEANKRYYKIKRVQNRQAYRNRQYLRAGTGLTSSVNDVQLGDANKQSFVVQYPVGAVPTVETDIGAGYVTRTVGVRGKDTGKDWYYQLGSPVISQDSSGTKLTATDKIKVTYQGQLPIVASADASTKIAARAAIEGTDGVYEAVESRPEIDSVNTADAVAYGLLSRYANFGDVVRFSTYTDGFTAGELVSITLPQLEISGQYLITQLRLTVDETFRPEYSVECVGETMQGGWSRIFKDLRDRRDAFSVRSNEIVILARDPSEALSISDVVNRTAYASGYAVDGTDTYIGGFYVS